MLSEYLGSFFMGPWTLSEYLVTLSDDQKACDWYTQYTGHVCLKTPDSRLCPSLSLPLATTAPKTRFPLRRRRQDQCAALDFTLFNAGRWSAIDHGLSVVCASFDLTHACSARYSKHEIAILVAQSDDLGVEEVLGGAGPGSFVGDVGDARHEAFGNALLLGETGRHGACEIGGFIGTAAFASEFALEGRKRLVLQRRLGEAERRELGEGVGGLRGGGSGARSCSIGSCNGFVHECFVVDTLALELTGEEVRILDTHAIEFLARNEIAIIHWRRCATGSWQFDHLAVALVANQAMDPDVVGVVPDILRLNLEGKVVCAILPVLLGVATFVPATADIATDEADPEIVGTVADGA